MIKEIKTKQELDQLANDWSPTWEGVALEGLEEQLKEIDPLVKIVYCTGKTYNKVYGLTGNNKYPDNLTIVFLKDYSKPKQLMWKMEYGCRWAWDVLWNNLNREGRADELEA